MLRIILAIICAAFVAITPTLAIPNQAYGWSGLKTEQALSSAGESDNLSWSIDVNNLPGAVQPGSSAVVWKNQNVLMNYATTNACIESGSITNTDKLWFMKDVKIVTKSGSSADIASVIPPGETIIYRKFIPCFERQEVNLQYKWQLQ